MKELRLERRHKLLATIYYNSKRREGTPAAAQDHFIDPEFKDDEQEC